MGCLRDNALCFFDVRICGIFLPPFQIPKYFWGPGGSMNLVVGLPNNSYKLITNTACIRTRLYKLQKGCTRLAAANDKAYQLLAHGRWFSPGTPASSTTKTGRHDIAEILLKVALSIINQIKSTSSEQEIVKQVSNGLRPIIRHPDSPVVR